MRRIPKMNRFLLVVAILFLVSCSGGGGGKSDTTAGGESLYDANVPVNAESFQNSCPISLKILDENGVYQPVSDGVAVKPGMKTMAVYIQGDQGNIKRVLVGDGGRYQVAAAFDASTGAYLCSYNVGSRMYSSVLVQVIHADNRASKEKFVFRTFDKVLDDQFIINGLSLSVSQDLLDSRLDDIASGLDSITGVMLDEVRRQGAGLISRLDYGDGRAGTPDLTVHTFEALQSETYPSAVIHTVFTVHGLTLEAVNLYGRNLVSTINNDVTMELFIAVKDEYGDGKRGLVLDLLGAAKVRFRDDFFLRPEMEKVLENQLQVICCKPLSVKLDKLFQTLGEAMPGSVDVNHQDIGLRALFHKMNIDLNRRLFLDVYGLPGETDPGILGLGMGFYLAEDGDTPSSGSQSTGGINVNDIFLDICEPLVEESFNAIQNKYSAITNISYGDGIPSTRDFQIESLSIEDTTDLNKKRVHTIITINDVDLDAFLLSEAFPIIHTADNDLTFDASFLLTYRPDTAVFDLDVEEISNVYFADWFLGRELVEGIVTKEISNLNTMTIKLDDVFQDLNFRVDLTDLGSGPLFPDVFPVYSSYNLDPLLPDNYSLGISVSQDSLNGFLSQLFANGFEWDGYEMVRALLGTGFIGFSNSPGEETIVRLNVPPVFDLNSSRMRMMVDDVILQNRKDGVPQWEISLDLDLIFDVRVEGGEIRLYVGSIPENCHFHVMKDNTGKLGVFDHSNMINSIIEELPEMLGKNPGDPVLSINIDDLKPVLYFDERAPLVISSGGGLLSIDAALKDIDLMWFFDKIL